MELKAGSRLQSSICDTQIMVVKAPADDVDITCGGVAMVAVGDNPVAGNPADGLAEGSAMGKRYTNEDGSLEVLCTKPGVGSVGLGETALQLKDAKPLPASD